MRNLKSKEQLLKEAKGFKLQIKICSIILLILSIIVCVLKPNALYGQFIIVPVVDVILFGIFIRMNTIISEYENILKSESQKNIKE